MPAFQPQPSVGSPIGQWARQAWDVVRPAFEIPRRAVQLGLGTLGIPAQVITGERTLQEQVGEYQQRLALEQQRGITAQPGEFMLPQARAWAEMALANVPGQKVFQAVDYVAGVTRREVAAPIGGFLWGRLTKDEPAEAKARNILALLSMNPDLYPEGDRAIDPLDVLREPGEVWKDWKDTWQSYKEAQAGAPILWQIPSQLAFDPLVWGLVLSGQIGGVAGATLKVAPKVSYGMYAATAEPEELATLILTGAAIKGATRLTATVVEKLRVRRMFLWASEDAPLKAYQDIQNQSDDVIEALARRGQTVTQADLLAGARHALYGEAAPAIDAQAQGAINAAAAAAKEFYLNRNLGALKAAGALDQNMDWLDRLIGRRIIGKALRGVPTGVAPTGPLALPSGLEDAVDLAAQELRNVQTIPATVDALVQYDAAQQTGTLQRIWEEMKRTGLGYQAVAETIESREFDLGYQSKGLKYERPRGPTPLTAEELDRQSAQRLADARVLREGVEAAELGPAPELEGRFIGEGEEPSGIEYVIPKEGPRLTLKQAMEKFKGVATPQEIRERMWTRWAGYELPPLAETEAGYVGPPEEPQEPYREYEEPAEVPEVLPVEPAPLDLRAQEVTPPEPVQPSLLTGEEARPVFGAEGLPRPVPERAEELLRPMDVPPEDAARLEREAAGQRVLPRDDEAGYINRRMEEESTPLRTGRDNVDAELLALERQERPDAQRGLHLIERYPSEAQRDLAEQRVELNRQLRLLGTEDTHRAWLEEYRARGAPAPVEEAAPPAAPAVEAAPPERPPDAIADRIERDQREIELAEEEETGLRARYGELEEPPELEGPVEPFGPEAMLEEPAVAPEPALEAARLFREAERVSLEDIALKPEKYQYRKPGTTELGIDERHLKDMMAAFDPDRLTAVKLREMPDGSLELMSGHHRYEMFRRLAETGWEDIPASAFREIKAEIYEDLTDKEARDLAIYENVGVKEYTPSEYGRIFALKTEQDVSVEELAKSFSKSPTFVRQHLHIDNLPGAVKDAVDFGLIGVKEAAALGEGMEKHGVGPETVRQLWQREIQEGDYTATDIRELFKRLAPRAAQLEQQMGMFGELPGMEGQRDTLLSALRDLKTRIKELRIAKRRWGGTIKWYRGELQAGRAVPEDREQAYRTALRAIEEIEGQIQAVEQGQLDKVLAQARPPVVEEPAVVEPEVAEAVPEAEVAAPEEPALLEDVVPSGVGKTPMERVQVAEEIERDREELGRAEALEKVFLRKRLDDLLEAQRQGITDYVRPVSVRPETGYDRIEVEDVWYDIPRAMTAQEAQAAIAREDIQDIGEVAVAEEQTPIQAAADKLEEAVKLLRGEPLARIEPRRVEVEKSRYQELLDAGVEPSEAVEQAETATVPWPVKAVGLAAQPALFEEAREEAPEQAETALPPGGGAEEPPEPPVDNLELMRRALEPPDKKRDLGAGVNKFLTQWYENIWLLRKLQKDTGIPVHSLAKIVPGMPVAGESYVREFIKPILETVGDDRTQLEEYMVAWRMKDLEAHAVKGRLPGFGGPRPKLPGGVKDARDVLNRLAKELAPERFAVIEEAGQNLWRVHDQLVLRAYLEAEIIDQPFYDAMREKWPHYIDWSRQGFEDWLPTGAGRKVANVAETIIKRMKEEGSERALDQPLDRMQAQVIRAQVVIGRNRAAVALVDALEEMQRLTGEQLVTWDKTTLTSDRGTISLYKKGEKLIAQVPKVYADVAKGLDAEGASILRSIFRAMALPLRLGAVAANPAWAVFNVVRDAWDAWATEGLVPGSREYIAAWSAVINKNTDWHEAARAGVFLSGAIETFFPTTELRRAKRLGTITVKNLGEVLAVIPRLVMLAGTMGEQATHLAAWKKLKAAGLSDLERAVRARDVTVDFASAGTVAKVVNDGVPFFTAGIRGSGSTVELLAGNRWRKALVRAAPLAAIAILFGLWNKRFETSKDIPDYEYALNFVLQIGEGTKAPDPRYPDAEPERFPIYVKIPKGYKAAFLMAPVDMLLRIAFAQDDRSVVEHLLAGARQAAQAMSPIETSPALLMPPFIGTWAQIKLNEDFFRGRQIVPEREMARPPEERYDRDVSRLAIRLGQQFKVSPRKIDFAVRDVTGGGGGMIAGAAGWLLDVALGGLGYKPRVPGEVRRQPLTTMEKLSRAPIIRRVVGTRGTQGLRTAYANLDEAVEDTRRRLYKIPEVRRFGLGINPPGQTITVNGVAKEVQPNQRKDIMELAAPLVERAWQELVGSDFYRAMDDTQKYRMLLRVRTKVQGNVRDHVLHELRGETTTLYRTEEMAELVRAFELHEQYDAIPRYIGMTKEEEEQVGQAESTLSSWARAYPNMPSEMRQRLYAQQDPMGAYLYKMRSKVQSPQRKAFWAANPLLSRYFGGVSEEEMGMLAQYMPFGPTAPGMWAQAAMGQPIAMRLGGVL